MGLAGLNVNLMNNPWVGFLGKEREREREERPGEEGVSIEGGL